MRAPDPRKITLQEDLVGPFVCALNGVPWVPGSGTAIGSVKSGELVGGVTYEHFNGGSVTLHVGGVGNWLTLDFLHYVFDYPFNQLGVTKVLGLVDSENLAAIRFDEHIGFHKEHTIEGAGRNGSDLIVYSMTRAQCRWLRNTNEQQQSTSST